MPQSDIHPAPPMNADTQPEQDPIQALPGFSRELQLLLCCGGPGIQAARGARLHRLLNEGLDWGLVFQLALWHRMLPLLYWNLTQANGETSTSVPGPATEALRAGYVRNISESLRMTADLLSILGRMEEEGVVAIPYKGPILSTRLYGNLGLRRSSDLDIIVRRDDLQKARKVLLSLGYEPSVILHAATEEFRVESRYSERFDRPGGVVELHWAFTNKDVAFPLSLDDLLPRLTTCRVSGRSIPVFAPEDTLLILCVHGAKHGWSRLEWICGVAELLHRPGGIRWNEVLRRARETKSLRRLLLGLCVAHDLYGSPLPEEVKKAVARDKQVGALARAVTSSLFVGGEHVDGLDTFGTLDHDLFHFRLGDGFPDSLRYLMYRITTPSRPEQWSTVTLGKRSISLHSFTRPFGIVSKVVPALWRRYLSSRKGER